MGEAFRCEVRGDFVGLLIDGVGSAKVKRVLLWLGLEVLNGLPEVIVCVPGLKGGDFEWMHPGIDWKWPGEPPVRVDVFDAIAVECAAYWKQKELFCSWSKGKDTG